MTNEHKDELTGLCKIEVKRWKAASEANPNMRYMVELMEVALATLTAQPDSWQQRAEAAEELNNHLELSVRKAEGVSESMRRRAQDAENKLLFTRPAPAINVADLVPDEMTPKQASRSYGGEVIGYRDGFNACRAAILRNIEEANK